MESGRGVRPVRVVSVVGARPNFVKIAPILRALRRVNQGSGAVVFESRLVHTEQHYDDEMSAAFFADLEIPRPDWTLGVGSASHAVQTAEIMRRFEPVVLEQRPDVVIVVGDVNSTAACALTAAKLGVKVAHVEAGLRSFDRTMPEEINRIVTDSVSDILFTSEESGSENLLREGHRPEAIAFVGNVMIDSLEACLRLARRSAILERLGLERAAAGVGFALVTMHRPSNVDAPETLRGILGALAELARETPVVFPAHPRTRQRIAEYDLKHYVDDSQDAVTAIGTARGRVSLLPPLGYIDFLRLMSAAGMVLTDSGGIQEETTCLGVPCLTLRCNTERPVTLTMGTNTLVGVDPDRILSCARAVHDNGRESQRPPLWDGHAADRIADALRQRL
jgi:UDP-N-acetylglucosamine 2-epimerase (non-hydrolysing)